MSKGFLNFKTQSFVSNYIELFVIIKIFRKTEFFCFLIFMDFVHHCCLKPVMDLHYCCLKPVMDLHLWKYNLLNTFLRVCEIWKTWLQAFSPGFIIIITNFTTLQRFGKWLIPMIALAICLTAFVRFSDFFCKNFASEQIKRKFLVWIPSLINPFFHIMFQLLEDFRQAFCTNFSFLFAISCPLSLFYLWNWQLRHFRLFNHFQREQSLFSIGSK